MCSTLSHWSTAMLKVFRELYRVAVPNGWVAFEEGEVRRGKIKLEEVVAPTNTNRIVLFRKSVQRATLT